MRVSPALWAALVGVVGLTGCDIEDFAGARYNQDFHYSYPLQSGGRLSIETFNGSIDLAGWDQSTVDISGTKYGPSPEAASALHIEVTNTPDSVYIKVVRPAEFRGNRGARFTVRMPRKAIVDRITTSNGTIQVMDAVGPAHLRTSNGRVRVGGFDGSLDVHTSNGSIELTDVTGEVVARTSNSGINVFHLRGPLEAGTSNGSINAELAAGSSGPVRLDTSNSGVDLTLPGNFPSGVRVGTSNGHITVHSSGPVNAQVTARTNNSTVTSDFEMRVQGELTRNHMDGTIGNGGPLWDLTTSNSPIRLLRM